MNHHIDTVDRVHDLLVDTGAKALRDLGGEIERFDEAFRQIA
jgi:hypothetical protein